jgi:hypothetical protein
LLGKIQQIKKSHHGRVLYFIKAYLADGHPRDDGVPFNYVSSVWNIELAHQSRPQQLSLWCENNHDAG